MLPAVRIGQARDWMAKYVRRPGKDRAAPMTRTRAIIGGVALAVLLATFLAGRASKHLPPAVTHDEVHATAATQATANSTTAAHVEAIAHESATGDTEAKTHTIIRWLPAVPAANGCPAVPAHVEQDTTTETHAATTRAVDRARASDVAAKQEQHIATQQTVVELHTSTPVRPRWSVSLMPGAQLFGAKALPLYGPLVIGASIERRIAGPVSLGLWGSTSGAAGITLRGDL